ncbi:MAG TPA: PHP domain-containing protein, partial [Cyclobacteriaceae bacterium]|nr:PHP domain-containing protein [Cyclobacteriaceae bacterium]
MYINCHTGFSFKYGTLPIKTLFDEAKRCGIHKLALTEINNTASYLELLRICYENQPQANGLTKYGKEAYPLELAAGIECRSKEQQLLYIILAKNNHGFELLNRFLSYHNREDKPLPVRAPVLENTFVIYPFQQIDPEQLHENEFIGVGSHQLITYAANPLRETFAHKFVALHSVTFLPPEKVKDKKTNRDKLVYRDHNTHRLLRCIAHNTLLSKLPVHQQARADEYMLPEPELRNRFAQFPDLLERSRFLLNQCSIECQPGVDKNKKYLRTSLQDDLQYLRTETEKGYAIRYGDDRTIWNNHIEKELRIIAHKGFISYYLITYNLILFARSKGYDFVGRGSGANSTVAYCLGITNVDPIELDLYFERFLNEERVTPPDFDIDFSWDNRDAIYEYFFHTYGYDHVCLLGTHVTYKAKSILRELGKVFGLPKNEIDALVESRKEELPRDHIAN